MVTIETIYSIISHFLNLSGGGDRGDVRVAVNKIATVTLGVEERGASCNAGAHGHTPGYGRMEACGGNAGEGQRRVELRAWAGRCPHPELVIE